MQRRLPIASGVFFGDGRWIPVQPQMIDELASGSAGSRYVIHPGVSRNIEELGREESDGFAAITELVEESASDESRNLRVCCGEGSYGGDGFVALLRADDGSPIWVAFFEDSNPFVSVRLTESEAIGVTNLGHEWRFPIDAPERVRVRPPGSS